MTASEQPYNNSTKQKKEKATVSLRAMTLSVWHKAKIQAVKKEITMTQYILELIEKDTSNQ